MGAVALKDVKDSLNSRNVKPGPGRDLPLALQLAAVGKAYGSVHAVKGVNFEAPAGSTVTLLGPSGCGKTTTLRCIAGLETPTHGTISVAGQTVYDAASGVAIPPERRAIGMVFQSYAIWPHMTVAGNVGFPLEVKGLARSEAREKVRQILDLVGLGHLADRPASQLSGGQQQRVALARALVFEPRLVLFDEPLSNLDASLRDRMRTELQSLQARLGFTAIYVTHDQQEALSLSDTVIVMNEGTIEQFGSPQEVFERPSTLFIAKFLGYSNVLNGTIVSVRPDGSEATVKISDHVALTGRCSPHIKIGDRAAVAFRAAHAVVRTGDSSNDTHEVGCTVEAVSFLGTHVEYLLKAADVHVKAEGAPYGVYARGDHVKLCVSSRNCHIFTYA